jgi:Fe-S-cluster containining protein
MMGKTMPDKFMSMIADDRAAAIAEMIAEIFSCTRCGGCCHGQTTVSLTADDEKRMSQALCLTPAELHQNYLRLTGNEVQMRIENGHCIFYQDGCRVHEGRPWRCAQWPLHPAILLDEANFIAIADSCPGIKKDIGYQRFAAILRIINTDGPGFAC